MENFFLDENYFNDLDGLVSHLDIDEDSVNELEDDWKIEVAEAGPEKIFQFSMDEIVEAIIDITDNWEERFDEDSDRAGGTFDKIKAAIRAGVDLDKINAALPTLWYPTGKTFDITKADLIEYFKDDE